DAVIPVNDKLTIRGGVRSDFVDTDIDSLPPGPFNLPNPQLSQTQVARILATLYRTTEFNRHYNLFGGFLTGEYKVNEHLKPFANFGVGQRAPTLTEMYAAGPFLAVVQNGLNNGFGKP